MESPFMEVNKDSTIEPNASRCGLGDRESLGCVSLSFQRKWIDHWTVDEGKTVDSVKPPLVFFPNWMETLTEALTSLLHDFRDADHIPLSWGKSLIVPIFSKGTLEGCRSCREISSIPIVAKILPPAMLRHLTPDRELCQ